MNKTEQNLVKAIDSGNYDNALEAFSKFTDLKSTTDEQSNTYFNKIEALQEVAADEVVVDEVSEDVEVVTEVVAPRVEKRGLKAKSKSRKEVEKAFNKALETAMDYKSDNPRGIEARFALKLVQQLTFIKKRLLR